MIAAFSLLYFREMFLTMAIPPVSRWDISKPHSAPLFQSGPSVDSLALKIILSTEVTSNSLQNVDIYISHQLEAFSAFNMTVEKGKITSPRAM